METQEFGERKPELKHKFIEVEGVKTHFVEAGKGDPLILVDGWYGSWRAFENHIPAFSQNKRVIALDLWGFGDSSELPKKHTIENYAIYLNDFLEILGIEKAPIVGVSLGGSVGLEFAARYPEKIDRLVVQGAPFYGRDLIFGVPPPPEWLSKKFGELFLKPVVQNPWLVLAFLRINPEKRKMSREELAEIAKRIPKRSYRAAQESLQSVLELDLREECKKLRAPTLILEGSMAFFPPLATGKRLHTLIPHSKLVVVRGAAHEMPKQKPAEFTKTIMDFLKD